jgi:NAD(P)-dependent dehydrogenase (short-subunit alcohol dehydrogenase family)
MHHQHILMYVHLPAVTRRVRTFARGHTTPPDLGEVVAFLVNDRASFITGQMLQVDGGWTHW